MAELHIEKKERRTGLWMVLALVVLALLAWWLFSQRDPAVGAADGDVAVPGATVDAPAGAAAGTAPAGAVQDFTSWVADRGARQDASRAHEYTADGIRRLSGALGAMVNDAGATAAADRAQVEQLRAHADAMQQDASGESHANHARLAFVQAADLMGTLQQRSYPNAASQVGQLRESATAVRADRPLLEQATQVEQFFERAATALQAMNGGSR